MTATGCHLAAVVHVGQGIHAAYRSGIELISDPMGVPLAVPQTLDFSWPNRLGGRPEWRIAQATDRRGRGARLPEGVS